MITRGKLAEDIASMWLQNKKLDILSRNFRCRWGEIDIIAMDRKILCFIEVKYRESSHYGTATEVVTLKKQQRIIKTAQTYLHRYSKYANKPTRFDVLSLTGNMDDPMIDWEKNAFMIPSW